MNAAWGRLISLPKMRQRKPLLATATMLLLAVLTVTPAWAQNIYTSQIGNRPAVVLSGDITANADDVFKAAAGQLQAPLVFLSSPGGNVAAALEIGRFIRMRALETVVADQQSCFSACALIWLGGAQRFMGQNARIGFHAAYRVRNGRTEESGVGNAMIGSYLANLGLPERVVMYVTLPGPDETQLLSMADAGRIGLAASLLPAGYAQPDRQVAQQVAPARPTVAPGQGGSGFPVAVGQSFRDCADVCPELMVIPAGSYMMGSPDGEAGRDADEGPRRRVTLREPLALGRFHVTVAEYRAFADATRRADPASCWTYGANAQWAEQQGRNWRSPGFQQTDRDPVVCVSWDDAKAYAAWLTQRTGKGYRLPSEAEWEWAARGRQDEVTTRWWWGEDGAAQCRNANGADQTSNPGNAQVAPCSDGFRYTSPVGRFSENGFRLHDMAGNAWQWLEDCYVDNYRGAPNDGAARQASGACSSRVLRGGSWNSIPQYLRSANRDWDQPGGRDDNVGFRVARTPG